MSGWKEGESVRRMEFEYLIGEMNLRFACVDCRGGNLYVDRMYVMK